jgi:molybdenum cofactor cytidylyltransferase
MGSSIARATEILADKASALLIILADQPLVTEEHLDSLLQRWTGSDTQIVASSYDNTRGAPVLLPDGCFPDLLLLDGDRGAKVLFDDPRFTLESIDFAPAAVDVDTAEDLARLSQPFA